MKAQVPLKILIIPGLIPYPPSDGGKLCVFGLIDFLRGLHHIHIILVESEAADNQNIEALRLKWPDVKVHSVGFYKGMPAEKSRNVVSYKQTARAAVRLFSLFFRRKPATAVPPGPYSRYNLANTMPFGPQPLALVKKISEVLAEDVFDIIQTETTPMLNLAGLFPPAAKKLFVQIEGRSEVLYDYGRANQLDQVFVGHVVGNTALIEYAFMQKYDGILALNEDDQRKIAANMYPETPVYLSPFGIPDTDIMPLGGSFLPVENLLFTGSEGHFPNADALEWFLREVMPHFSTLPFMKLYVTGTWSGPFIEMCKGLLPAIEFVGFVDDLAPLARRSVSIVPIRIGGGGIRTKILYAMAQGSPVVSTTLGAFGIPVVGGESIMLADTSHDLADAIQKLFADATLREKVRRNALQLIHENYKQSVVGKIRSDIYYQICGRSALQTNNGKA